MMLMKPAHLDGRSFLCVSYSESGKVPLMHILTSDNDY